MLQQTTSRIIDVCDAYIKIFNRLGFEYVIVHAMSGAMGGSASEEFLALGENGEDTFVRSAGGYAANVHSQMAQAGWKDVFGTISPTISVSYAAAHRNEGFGVFNLGTDEHWAQSLEVNLMAHVRAARLVVPAWLERGSGRFVSVARTW